MIRSVAFAFVTKVSGAAMVFIALPIISHGLSADDYATFLTTMNIGAAAGLPFAPFEALYIREMARAFASEDHTLARTAVRNTFGANTALTLIVFIGLAIGLLATHSFIPFRSSMLLGIVLFVLQIAASWGQSYRIAERSDYVSSIVQTICNVSMVAILAVLSMTQQMTDFSVSAVYFGIPALGALFIFCQILLNRRVRMRVDRSAFVALKDRVPECVPLYLGPVANYVRVYASSMLVLAASNSYNYIVFSTSIILIARLVNPVTLITRPMMPAFIDALHRNDILWLVRLKHAFFVAAAFGAVAAAILPFFLHEKIVYFAFPKDVHDVSIVYVIFCSYFAFAYALVALLAPLYIGSHRAALYGLFNLAFTLAAAVVGTLLCGKFGASAMMGALAVITTMCGIFLLTNTAWTKDSYLLKHGDGRLV